MSWPSAYSRCDLLFENTVEVRLSETDWHLPSAFVSRRSVNISNIDIRSSMDPVLFLSMFSQRTCSGLSRNKLYSHDVSISNSIELRVYLVTGDEQGMRWSSCAFEMPETSAVPSENYSIFSEDPSPKSD